MSMACGLETRVASLDHELAELAFRLPDAAKLRAGQAKLFLKQIASRYLPAELLKKNPGWREAVFSDSKDPISQQNREQNQNYNPYYAEGDLNQDGLKDFVIVVIPESADKGSVFWFPGTTEGYEQEERVMRVKAIDRLSISISNAGELLIIDSNTNVTLRFTWDKDDNKLVQSSQ